MARPAFRLLAAVALAVVILAAASLAGPAKAATKNRPCLWDELPTLVQARLELAVRLGEKVPVAAVNRLGKGGLAKHLKSCGFSSELADVDYILAYWLATAARNVARARARIVGVDVIAIEAELDARTPAKKRAKLAEAVMARKRGVAEPVLLKILEKLEKTRAAKKQPALTTGEKRLAVEFALARIILLGLDAGAAPPAGKSKAKK